MLLRKKHTFPCTWNLMARWEKMGMRWSLGNRRSKRRMRMSVERLDSLSLKAVTPADYSYYWYYTVTNNDNSNNKALTCSIFDFMNALYWVEVVGYKSRVSKEITRFTISSKTPTAVCLKQTSINKPTSKFIVWISKEKGLAEALQHRWTEKWSLELWTSFNHFKV